MHSKQADGRMRAFALRAGAALVGGVFLYAGAVKMHDSLAFADSVASFKILPIILINPFALTLPPLEILTGLMLVVAAVISNQ